MCAVWCSFTVLFVINLNLQTFIVWVFSKNDVFCQNFEIKNLLFSSKKSLCRTTPLHFLANHSYYNYKMSQFFVFIGTRVKLLFHQWINYIFHSSCAWKKDFWNSVKLNSICYHDWIIDFFVSLQNLFTTIDRKFTI